MSDNGKKEVSQEEDWTIDFKSYRQEKSEAITISTEHGDYKAPASPPLSVIEGIVELEHSNEDEVPPERLITMLKTLLGEEAYKELRDTGADIDDLYWLFDKIFEVYDKKGTLGPMVKEGADDQGKDSTSSPTYASS